MSQESSEREGKVLLASPRGFCAGVVRAIDIVNLALERYGQPLYVRREIVHNKFVVNQLREKGTIFVEDLEEVPEGGRVIFSAHGVSPEVRSVAKVRNLSVIDATCPLVTKVHIEAIKYARNGYTIILIGHADHDEVEGTLGEAPSVMHMVSSAADVEQLNLGNPERIAYLTQTTLSLDDAKEIISLLRLKYPHIEGPASEDICYATQNRQRAVLELTNRAETILVVGSKNSSNSRRLVEVSQSAGVPAHLIDNSADIQPDWLDGVRTIGLTAGASAPEELVEHVIEYLKRKGFPKVETIGSIVEHVEFALPPELSKSSPKAAK
jgi:4-hydroxy-3-methylbut-2-en-1-yl diphosphate reductase